MKEIMGTIYMTEKEAAKRYCLSTSWFSNARSAKAGPPFTRMVGKSKVHYELAKTDAWFKERMKDE